MEYSLASIWKQDITEVYSELARLEQEGIDDISQYLNQNPDYVLKLIGLIKTIKVNKISLKIFEADSKKQLINSIGHTFGDGTLDVFKNLLEDLWNNKKEAIYRVNLRSLKEREIKCIIFIKFPDKLAEEKIISTSILDISNQIEIENSLKQSEQDFQSVILNIDEVVFSVKIVDSQHFDNPIKFISENCDKILGFKAIEFMENPQLWYDRILIEDRPAVIDASEKLFSGKKSVKRQYRFKKKDGSIIHLEDTLSINNDILYGNSRDITESQALQKAKNISDQRLRVMFDDSPIGLAINDSENGTMYEVNTKFAEILGTTVKDIAKLNWMDITHPDDIQPGLDLMAQLNAGEIDRFQLKKRFYIDGKLIYTVINVNKLGVDDNGRKIHLTTIEDLTEKVKIEENYKNLFNDSPLGKAITGLESGKIYKVNRMFCEILGRNESELVGINLGTIVHQDDLTRNFNENSKLLKGEVKTVDFEKRYTHPSKGFIYCRINIFKTEAFDNEYGEPIAYSIIEDITEKKEFELKIREQRQLQETLLNTINMGLVIHDILLNPIIYNKKAYEIFRITKEEWLQSPLLNENLKVVDINGLPLVQSEYPAYKAINNGEIVLNTILGVQFKDEMIWISISSQPYTLEDGSKRSISSYVDVTEKIKNIRKEKLFLGAFESMAEGVVVHDAKGQIVSFNKAAPEILKLSKDQLLGKSSFDKDWKAIKEDGSDFPGDEHPAMVALATGKHMKDVVMGIHINNTQTWIKINATPINYNNSKDPDAVVALFQDITVQRKKVAELKELSSEYTNLKNTIFKYGDILTTDKDGVIVQVSEKYSELHGYNADQLIGQHSRIFNSGYHSKDEIKELWNIINSGQIWTGVFRNKTKDKQHKWVRTIIIPLLDHDGIIKNFMSLRQDITFEREAQDENKKRKDYFKFLNNLQSYLIENPHNLDIEKVIKLYADQFLTKRISVYEVKKEEEELFSRIVTVYPYSKNNNDWVSIDRFSLELKEYVERLKTENYIELDFDELPLKPQQLSSKYDIKKCIIFGVKIFHQIKYIINLSFEKEINWSSWQYDLIVTSFNSIRRTIEKDIYEQKFEESAYKYREVFNSFMDIYYERDLDDNLVLISPSVYSSWGYKPQDFNRLDLKNIYKNIEDRDKLMSQLNEREEASGEVILLKKDGSEIVASIRIQKKYDRNGERNGIVGIIRDITENKRNEQKLKDFKEKEDAKLLNSLIKGQDEERRRVSRELHDGLGQLITAIKLRLEILVGQKTDKNDEYHDLLSLLQIVESAGFETKRMSHGLLPSVLEDFGLKAGITKIVEISSVNTLLKIQFITNLSSENRFDPEFEINIYRIIQEWINNSLKHSDAKNLSITLNLDKVKRTLNLFIEDDGSGFDVSEIKKGGKLGSGLVNIQERCKLIGGECDIKSSKGDGSKFTLILAL